MITFRKANYTKTDVETLIECFEASIRNLHAKADCTTAICIYCPHKYVCQDLNKTYNYLVELNGRM